MFEDGWHPIQGTTNERRLAEFQVAFASHGVVDPTMKELARSARPDETPPDWFFPLADAAATLIPLLHLAFQNQRLKKGATSLELAELNDNYGMEDAHTQKPPWGYTEQGPWHELPVSRLARFGWGNLAFMNVDGLRYYIPACIKMVLEGTIPGDWEINLNVALCLHHDLDEFQRALSEEEARTIARYVAYLAADPTSDWYDHARASVRKWWTPFLTPEHAANLATEVQQPLDVP